MSKLRRSDGLVAIGAIGAVLLVALAMWLTLGRRGQKDECAFLGWKDSIGVDAEAVVGKLQSVKGQLGIADSSVRDFDVFLKDYGARYETTCQDYVHKRISAPEYNCRRQNMDRALGNIRALQSTLQSLDGLKSADAQKDVILKAIGDFHELAASEYKAGCSAAISVDPKRLSFHDHFPELSIQITNSGNNDLIYTVEDLPQAFKPVPRSAHLMRGETATVALCRMPFKWSSEGPIVFSVTDNWNDRVPVEVEVSSENAQLYEGLGVGAAASLRPPTTPDSSLDVALKVVDTLPSTDMAGVDAHRRSAIRLLYAAGVLQEAGQPQAASAAMDSAMRASPDIESDPTTQLFSAFLAYRTGNSKEAQSHCATAKSLAIDAWTRGASDMCSGAIQLSSGNELVGYTFLSDRDVRLLARRSPLLTQNMGLNFQVPFLNSAIETSALRRDVALIKYGPRLPYLLAIVASCCAGILGAYVLLRRFVFVARENSIHDLRPDLEPGQNEKGGRYLSQR